MIALLAIALASGTALAAAKVPRPRRAPPRVALHTLSAFQLEQRMSFAQLMNRWNVDIAVASKRFNVPASWIRAVMQVESGGRTMMAENLPTTSSKGAMGLMQLMPSTYADMRAQYGLGANPYDPADNIVAGSAYLKWLRAKYGYPQMFAAYNDGPGHLDQRLRGAGLLPLETRNYLVRISGVLSGRGGGAKVKFTKPNGEPVMVNVVSVIAVRAAFPGEYAACVQSVITIGRLQQGVCEPLAKTRAILRARGAAV
jgi:soluble lytic murein transglycosylase-like protein